MASRNTQHISVWVLAVCSLGAAEAQCQPLGGLDRLLSDTSTLHARIERLSDNAKVEDLAPLLNQLQLVQFARQSIGSNDREKALRPYLDRELGLAEELARSGHYVEAERRTGMVMDVLRSDRRVNIEIVSEPTRANATFLYYNREKAKELVTDEIAQGLAVGEYTLEVSRPGYKTGTTQLNLLWEAVPKVTCTLVTEDDQQLSACHKPPPAN
jgi:hypothetical protein